MQLFQRNLEGTCSLLLVIALLCACTSTPGQPTPRDDDAEHDSESVVWQKTGHFSPVHDAAPSPDGRFLMVATYAPRLFLLDADTGATVNDRIPEHTGFAGLGPTSVDWSADGRQLAAGGGSAYVFDTTTWDFLDISEDSHTVEPIRFSPSGELVAVGVRPRSGGQVGCICLVLRRADSGEEVARVSSGTDASGQYRGYIRDLAWSPSGQHVLATHRYGTFIYDVDAGIASYRFLPPGRSVAWSPAGDAVAVVDRDGKLRIADAATGAILTEVDAHTSEATTVAWHPSRSELVTGSSDGEMSSWDSNTGRRLVTSSAYGGINSLRYSSDGDLLLVGTTAGHVEWLNSVDLERTLERRLTGGRIISGDVSSDGMQLATGGFDRALRIWDVASGDLQHEIFQRDHVESVAWSPDDRVLATNDWTTQEIRVYDTQTWTVLRTFPVPYAEELHFSPDGRWLAADSVVAGIVVIDLAAGDGATQSFSGYNGFGWSPDGAKFATGQYAFRALTFHATGDGFGIAWREPTSVGSVRAVSWRPQGDVFAMFGTDDNGSLNPTVEVFDAPSGDSLETYTYVSDTIANDVGWSPNGDYFFTAGGADRVHSPGDDYGAGDFFVVKFFDFETGEIVHGIESFGAALQFTEWLPNDDSVLMASWNGVLRLERVPLAGVGAD